MARVERQSAAVLMPPTGYRWSGHIRKGDAPDSIVGSLVDPFGFSIEITGQKVDGRYELVGIPGAVPAEFWIPGLDDE